METSGVILFAKSELVSVELDRQFRDREVNTYTYIFIIIIYI